MNANRKGKPPPGRAPGRQTKPREWCGPGLARPVRSSSFEDGSPERGGRSESRDAARLSVFSSRRLARP